MIDFNYHNVFVRARVFVHARVQVHVHANNYVRVCVSCYLMASFATL
jgi:hypothetical protein